MSCNGSKASPGYLFLSIILVVLTHVICFWLLGEEKKEEKHAGLQLWFRIKIEEHV
jgi:hypothetical protein